MTIVLQARSLVEHMRHICERPRMYAPDFTLTHLFMFIQGYEAALEDAGLPSEHVPFREWIFNQRPEWRTSSMWWGGHVLEECSNDLDRALDQVINLIDRFLDTEGFAFTRSPRKQREGP
jgi:hypothetical protein